MKRSTLEKAYDTYSQAIEAYAKERFENVVKPYLEKNGYTFVCGVGWGWSIFNETHRIPEDKIPSKVLFELDFPVPGMNKDITLAYWMPEFGREEKTA